MRHSTCECEEDFRSACVGLPATEYYDGKRFCLLHSPSSHKQRRFDRVLKDKLDNGSLDFRGVFFPGETSISQRFDADVDFYGATFVGRTDFGNAEFCGEASFEGARFCGEVSFERTRFCGEAVFRHAMFDKATCFYEANFEGQRTSFYKAKFNREGTTFESATFAGERTNFDGAQFLGECADFHHARFRSDYTYFGRARFAGLTDFSRCEFQGRTYLGGVTFAGAETTFFRAIFSGSTFFGFARFCKKVFFVGAEFAGELTSFQKTVFGEEVDFGRAQFANTVVFHTVDLRPVSFLDAVGLREAHFTNVNWKPYGRADGETVPIAKADLNEETKALKVVFTRPGRLLDNEQARRRQEAKTSRCRPEPGHNVEVSDEQDARKMRALLSKTYRELAINQEENRRYYDAGVFNYRSLDLERRDETNSRRKALFGLHRFLSGYWEQPTRALGVLIALWLLFAVAFLALSFFHDDTSAAAEAFAYSAGNLTLQTPAPKPEAVPWYELYIVTAERILGPVQIGFLALSLRRQFMR